MSIFNLFGKKNSVKKNKARRFSLEHLEERQLLDAAGIAPVDETPAIIADEEAYLEETLVDEDIDYDNIAGVIADLDDGGTLYLNASTDMTVKISKVISINKSISIVSNGDGSITLTGNSARIFRVSNAADATINIENLTFKDGFAGSSGGAIYIAGSEGATVNLTSCVFMENQAGGTEEVGKGGALYAEGVTINITGCTFTDNKVENVQETPSQNAKGLGGAINLAECTVTIKDTEIAGNWVASASAYGGGMAVYQCNITIDNTAVSDNEAICDKSQISTNKVVYGGGLYFEGLCDITITNSEVTGNTARSASTRAQSGNYYVWSAYGGGIATVATGATSETNVLKMTNVTVSGNTAKWTALETKGGGLYCKSRSVISLCHFDNNVVGSTVDYPDRSSQGGWTCGGGIYNEQRVWMQLFNCTIIGNEVRSTEMYGNSFAAGIYNNWGLIAYDCTVTNNKILRYPGTSDDTVYHGSGYWEDKTAASTWTRCIIVNNYVTDWNDGDESIVYYSDMWTNTNNAKLDLVNSLYDSSTFGGKMEKYAYTDGIDLSGTDIAYADVINADGTLTATSPAIAASGTTETFFAIDSAGNPRVYGTYQDFGAFEYQGAREAAATTLSVGTVVGTKVTVNWDAIPGVKYFDVEYSLVDPDSEAFEEWTVVAGQPGTSYTITGLELGATVWARVIVTEAVDTYSNVVSATTAYAQLDTPEIISVVDNKDTTVTVTWTAVDNITNYKLEAQTDDGEYITVYEGTDTSFSKMEFALGSKVAFRVTAIGDNIDYIDSEVSDESAILLINITGYEGWVDGNSHSVTLDGVAETDTVLYSLDGENWSEKNFAFRKAGIYTVYAQVTRDNVTWTDSATITLKKYVKVAWEGLDGEYTYNAQDQGENIKAYYTDSNGEKQYVDVAFSGTENIFRNAGGYVVKTAAVDGAYYLTGTTKTARIGKAEITVTATAQDKAYDGRVRAFGAYQVVGAFEGDVVKISGGKYEFEDANVGENKTVTFSKYTCSNSNYKLANLTAETTATIRKKALIVQWEGLDQEYHFDGTDQSASITAYCVGINNERFDLAVTFTFIGHKPVVENAEFSDVGLYRVAASWIADNDCYIITGTTKLVEMLPPVDPSSAAEDDFDFVTEEFVSSLNTDIDFDF